MAKIKRMTTTSVGKGVKQLELCITAGGSGNWSHQLRNSQQIPAMAVAIPLLGICSEEMSVYATKRHVQGCSQCHNLQ